MTDPLISVVMPTYNHEKFISEAIDSVLLQTYKNLELIIIDNYSDDNTENIITKKNSKKIKYIKFSNNGIIAASRNIGIRNSKGNYIAFIDSDDIWFKNKIKKQFELIKKDSAIGLVSGYFIIKDSNDNKYEKTIGPKNKNMDGFIYKKLIKSNFITSSSVLLKRSVIEDIGVFDESEDIVCSEDFDLWLRIARKYKVSFVYEPIGYYRKHLSNISASEKRLQKAIYVIDKHLNNRWIKKNQSNNAKANFYFCEGWNNILNSSSLARLYFIRAIKLNFYNIKIFMLSLLGFVISFIPFLFKYIREKNLDRIIGDKIFNSQDL